MDAAVSHVLSKKDEILGLFRDQPELSRPTRNRSMTYIRQFFAILEDETALKEQVLDRCRGRHHLDAMMAPDEEPATDSM